MENTICINSVETERSNRFCGIQYKTALQHIGLLLVLMCYTGFGGWVFRYLEFPAEASKLEYFNNTLYTKRLYFVTSIVDKSGQNLSEFISTELEGYEQLLTTAIASGYPAKEDDPDREKWTYLKAVFFSSTVLTTIGYGNIVPVTTEGRIFCIVYALVGIPLTLIVIADWGRLFASSFSACVRHVSPLPSNADNNVTSARRRSYVFLSVCFLFVYLSAGAALFVIWEEDWTFTDGFYFCFITMTTIGFGDLVPRKPKYMLVCIIYILVGLALTSTIIELVRRQYAKSWQQLQALRGPLAYNFKKIAENAPGLDVIAFQHDLMKVLTVVTKQKKNYNIYEKPDQTWNGNWDCSFDFVMGRPTSTKPPIVQMVIYESSV